MSILCLNKPHKFIIVHMFAKPTHVFRVGILCTRSSPHGRLPRPNPDDYNLNPNTHDGEFYQQEEGLPGMLEIDLTGEIEMEADVEWVVDEDAANEVHDPKDLEMLDGLRLGNDNDEDEAVEDLDNLDSDDDTYHPDNPDHEEY